MSMLSIALAKIGCYKTAMTVRLFVLLVLFGIVDQRLAEAQASRVPARPGSAEPDVSDYASPDFMRMLVTGRFQELEGIGRSNRERARIRGYLFGLFDAVGPLVTAPATVRAGVSSECSGISAELGNEQQYLRGWIRDYVKAFQISILTSATLPGVLGPAGVAAGQGEFGDLQDIVQDGKTDGGRLVKTLKTCDAPALKTIVANARTVHHKYPSTADVYVPTMPTASALQSFAGRYAVERSTSVAGIVTVAVAGNNLTLTDPQGRSFELRPTGDYSFEIAGTPRGGVTFYPRLPSNPQLQGLSFTRGDVVFIASRLDAQLDLQSPAGQYQSLVGQYTVISNIPPNLNLAVNVSRASALTVAVSGSNLTLTDSQGRTHQLQPAGSRANEFAIAGTPQATIRFLPGSALIYQEGKVKFSATRETSGRVPRQ